jgi:hypothetical protein
MSWPAGPVSTGPVSAEKVLVPGLGLELAVAALLALAILAVACTPETVQERLVRPSYRPQRISMDHGERANYLAAAASALASFAAFGLFTSVAPGFVARAG